MSSRSPMAAKTAKARKMAMLEAKYVQEVGDSADYLAGREVRVYDSLSSRADIDRRERFVAEHRMLTPCEDWCVARGLIENPFVKQVESRKTLTLYPVDFPDGRRTRARSLAEARGMLTNGALRLWNVEEKMYEYSGMARG